MVVACDLLCTSAFIIFHTSSHSDFTLCFFDLSIKILALILSSRSHSTLLTAISYQRLCLLLALLFCLRLALLFDYSGVLGSCPWLFFFVLHVRLIRVLLLTSWLTHALSPFLPSSAAIGLLFLAPSTRCRLLLLFLFLVSARWLLLA